MSERFEQLYKLSENLYSDKSPLILSAGSLLKDIKSGAIIVQLKFQSLSDEIIKAVKISLSAYDVSGAEIKGVDEYQYLDLEVKNGQEFGSDKAIIMPDSVTRSFAVKALSVVTADGKVQNISLPLNQFPSATSLETALTDTEVLRQYKIATSSKAAFIPQKNGSLWQCTCGKWNSSDECTTCKCTKETVFSSYNIKSLSADAEIRLAEEKRKAEETRKEADRIAEENRKKTKKQKALAAIASAVVCVIIAVVIVINAVIIPNGKYNDAMELIEAKDYETAYAILEEIDKPEAITKNKYDRAIKYIGAKDYELAYDLLDEIGDKETIANNKLDRAFELLAAKDYVSACDLLDEIEETETIINSKYDRAVEFMDAENYEAALILFKQIPDYKDVQDRINSYYSNKYGEETWNKIKDLEVGDTYTFGTYEQDNNTSNGKEPIEWIVLEKNDYKLFVVSKYALDYQTYYDKFNEAVTWKDCLLRKWLNNDFINTAFSDEERAMIPITAHTESKYAAEPGDVQDQVFLLSVYEADRYFDSDAARQCLPTAYAVANGTFENPLHNGNCSWKLRTQGKSNNTTVAVVESDGSIYDHGTIAYGSCSVRPALWIAF